MVRCDVGHAVQCINIIFHGQNAIVVRLDLNKRCRNSVWMPINYSEMPIDLEYACVQTH